MKMSHPNVYMETTECYQKLQHDDIGMRSKNLLEDWLKLCDALLISITVQNILCLHKKKRLTNLILTESIRVKHCLN